MGLLIDAGNTFEVEDEAGNAIVCRGRMDIATEAAVAATVRRICPTPGGVPTQVYTLALLVHNVVGWRGPAFGGVAFSADAVRRLDPESDLVKRAIRELAQRNTAPRVSPAGEDSLPENFPRPPG